MNERIKELAELAMEWIPDPGYSGQVEVRVLNHKKFAELIVKECAELMPQDNLHKMVLKHFEVKWP